MQARGEDPHELHRRRRLHLGPGISPGGASRSSARGQVDGRPLPRPGDQDGGDHADLTIGGAFGPAKRPSRHALRSQSTSSGGSASRIVIGRSLVAGLCLSPRPNLPHRRAAAPRGRVHRRAGNRRPMESGSEPSVQRRSFKAGPTRCSRRARYRARVVWPLERATAGPSRSRRVPRLKPVIDRRYPRCASVRPRRAPSRERRDPDRLGGLAGLQLVRSSSFGPKSGGPGQLPRQPHRPSAGQSRR